MTNAFPGKKPQVVLCIPTAGCQQIMESKRHHRGANRIQWKQQMLKQASRWHILTAVLSGQFCVPQMCRAGSKDRWVAPMPGRVLKDLNFADKIIGLENAEAVKQLRV
eukprot:645482-Amphidinium_carterae.1